ncbi:unnamed protein product, partial [Toxocara canis]|uniref:Capsid protein n=1 Tax=Toxocara canis TaxID=6265 RepID=A0A183U884_TOXCA
FDIQYRSTTNFDQADGLSRLIGTQTTPNEDQVIAAISVETDMTRTLPNAVNALPINSQRQ